MIVIIWLADKNWNWNRMEFELKLFWKNGTEIGILKLLTEWEFELEWKLFYENRIEIEMKIIFRTEISLYVYDVLTSNRNSTPQRHTNSIDSI